MLAILGLVLLLQATDVASDHDRNSCGVSCCYIFLHESGNPIAWDSVAGEFPPGHVESSFLDLKRVLHRHGVEVRAIETTFEEIKKIRQPVIAQTFLGTRAKEGYPHFVVLLPHGDNLLLLDPMLGKPVVVNAEVESLIGRQFTGNVLIGSNAVVRAQSSGIVVVGVIWGLSVALAVWLFSRAKAIRHSKSNAS